MIVYLILDLSTAFVFFLIGLLFFVSNGSAVKYLSGYNTKSDEERKSCDEKKMCKAYGKRIMIFAVPFLIGAGIDTRVYGVGYIIAWIVWLILFVLLVIERNKREKQDLRR